MAQQLEAEVLKVLENELPKMKLKALQSYFDKAESTERALKNLEKDHKDAIKTIQSKDREITGFKKKINDLEKLVETEDNLKTWEANIAKRELEYEKAILEIKLQCEQDKNAHLYNFTELVVQKEKKKIWYHTVSESKNESFPNPNYQGDSYNQTVTGYNTNTTVESWQKRDEDDNIPDAYSPNKPK